MPRRLTKLYFSKSKKELEELCRNKQLNEYETEIIIRIYHDKQSLNFVADTMDFIKYGKSQQFYSVRTINNYHKEAFKKLFTK